MMPFSFFFLPSASNKASFRAQMGGGGPEPLEPSPGYDTGGLRPCFIHGGAIVLFLTH